MSYTEDNTPVERRYLFIEGIVSCRTLTYVKDGMPEKWDKNAIWCFLLYAYADIPVGKVFDRLFSLHDVAHGVSVRCIVRAITQEYKKPFDMIPHGWKTITLLEFAEGIPDKIKTLPTIDAWGKSVPHAYLCISSEETWQALLQNEQKKRT